MSPVHVLDAAQRLDPGLAIGVRPVVESALAETTEHLGLAPIDVVVCDYPGLTDAETGIGGYCPGPSLAFVAVEPRGFGAGWQQELFSTTVHELHHAKRWQGPGYGERLIDSLVAEGLATAYEVERTGIMPRHARNAPDLDGLWSRVTPLLDERGLHAPWFFGSSGIPRWAGYALGTELVTRYCRTHATTAAGAALVPSDAFRDAWSAGPG